MKKYDTWPPPEWEECRVSWGTMLDKNGHDPNLILDWVDATPGGLYHLHGYGEIEGFAFRFKRPKDATHFRLIWY